MGFPPNRTAGVTFRHQPDFQDVAEVKIEKTSEDGSIVGVTERTPGRSGLNDSGYYENPTHGFNQTPPREFYYMNDAMALPYQIPNYRYIPMNPNGQDANQNFSPSQYHQQMVRTAVPPRTFLQRPLHMSEFHPQMMMQYQQRDGRYAPFQHFDRFGNHIDRVDMLPPNGLSPAKVKMSSDRTTSPGPIPANFDPEIDGSTTHPILCKISKYSLTSASTGINFYFRIYARYFKARRDSFSKDKTMMYLRCNTCPKEPCKWRAKIRLLKPEIKIEDNQCIENYQVLSNTKAHHHHPACRELSLSDSEMIS